MTSSIMKRAESLNRCGSKVLGFRLKKLYFRFGTFSTSLKEGKFWFNKLYKFFKPPLQGRLKLN